MATSKKPSIITKSSKLSADHKVQPILPAQMIPKQPLKPILLLALALIIVGTAWYVFAAARAANSTLDGSLETVQKSTNTKTHSPGVAVQAAKALYDAYLPIKSQATAEVGDSIDIEPANVQAIRATKTYYSKDFYNKALADYMREFQATSHVTIDNVTCVGAVQAVSSITLDSHTPNTATTNVSFVLPDGTTDQAKVVIDRHTLKATKITCDLTKEN